MKEGEGKGDETKEGEGTGDKTKEGERTKSEKGRMRGRGMKFT